MFVNFFTFIFLKTSVHFIFSVSKAACARFISTYETRPAIL